MPKNKKNDSFITVNSDMFNSSTISEANTKFSINDISNISTEDRENNQESFLSTEHSKPNIQNISIETEVLESNIKKAIEQINKIESPSFLGVFKSEEDYKNKKILNVLSMLPQIMDGMEKDLPANNIQDLNKAIDRLSIKNSIDILHAIESEDVNIIGDTDLKKDNILSTRISNKFEKYKEQFLAQENKWYLDVKDDRLQDLKLIGNYYLETDREKDLNVFIVGIKEQFDHIIKNTPLENTEYVCNKLMHNLNIPELQDVLQQHIDNSKEILQQKEIDSKNNIIDNENIKKFKKDINNLVYEISDFENKFNINQHLNIDNPRATDLESAISKSNKISSKKDKCLHVLNEIDLKINKLTLIAEKYDIPQSSLDQAKLEWESISNDVIDSIDNYNNIKEDLKKNLDTVKELENKKNNIFKNLNKNESNLENNINNFNSLKGQLEGVFKEIDNHLHGFKVENRYDKDILDKYNDLDIKTGQDKSQDVKINKWQKFKNNLKIIGEKFKKGVKSFGQKVKRVFTKNGVTKASSGYKKKGGNSR